MDPLQRGMDWISFTTSRAAALIRRNEEAAMSALVEGTIAIWQDLSVLVRGCLQG
jgi:hypothetical protein